MTAIQDDPSHGSVPEEPVPAQRRPVAVTRPTLVLPGSPTTEVMAGNEDDGYQWAARIEERNVGWLVVFGAYTREFVAFLRPVLPVSGWLACRDPGRLVRLMRQAEAGAMPQGLQAAESAAGSLVAEAEGAA